MAEPDLHAVAFPKFTEAQLAALGRCPHTKPRRFRAALIEAVDKLLRGVRRPEA